MSASHGAFSLGGGGGYASEGVIGIGIFVFTYSCL